MPTDTIPPENKPVAERIRAGMTAFGFDYHGGKKAFAARYKRDPAMVSDWRKGRFLPGTEDLFAMCMDWNCTFEWLRFGKGNAPAWYTGESAESSAIPFISKEQHADGDAVAVRIALESLIAALLPRTQGVAGAFLADLTKMAKKHRFSTKRGLLLKLCGIAQEVQNQEAKAAPTPPRAGSAGRKRT